jgi:hypothetical protein
MVEVLKAEAKMMNIFRRLRIFGAKKVLVGIEYSTDKADQEIVRSYEQKGFEFNLITSDSPPEMICRLGDIFAQDYFLKQYPLNRDAKKREEFILSRLNNGEICTAVLYADDIAIISWLGFEKTYRLNKMVLARDLTIDFSNTAYTYNTYAKEQYRGQSLQVGVKHFQFSYLKKRNYRKIIGFIGARNTASLVNAAKIGRYIGVIIETNYGLFKDYQFLPIDFPGS